MNRGLLFACLAALLAGCGSGSAPAAPSVVPTTSSGSGGPPPITGLERLGWTQVATDASVIAGLGFVMYVDGNRALLQTVDCVPGDGGFACSSQLPPMSNGGHSLELAAFLKADTSQESDRSGALYVVVAAAGAAASADDLQSLTGRRVPNPPSPRPLDRDRPIKKN